MERYHIESKTLDDVKNSRDSGFLNLIERNSTSVTYLYTHIYPSQFYYLVSSDINILARFKIIIHPQTRIYYGLYEPPSLSVNLIPFKITDAFNCSFTVSITSQTITAIQLVKPQENPTQSSNNIINIGADGNFKIYTDGVSGQWYIRVLINQISWSSLYIQNVDINLQNFGGNGDDSCSATCSPYLELMYQGMNFNNIINECECLTGYQRYSSAGICYVNCSYRTFFNGFTSSMYANQDSRCDCVNSTQSYIKTINPSCSSQCINIQNVDPNSNNNRLVSQGCICLSGYLWDQTQRICLIDCNLVQNAVNKTTRYSSMVCYCPAKHAWDYTTKTCKLNCSLVSNALIRTNRQTLSNTETCACKPNFMWNSSLLECKRICIVASTSDVMIGQDPLDISRCRCTLNSMWNVTTQKCEKICQVGDIWDISIQLCHACQEGDKIICCSGNLSYSTAYSGCIANCSRTANPFTYALDQADPSRCLCDPGFRWSVSLNKCVRNCSREIDRYATGINMISANYSECLCDWSFFWSSTVSKCIRNCTTAADSYSAGNNLANPGKCNCNNSFIWNFEFSKCARNCTKQSDKYAIGVNETNVSACLCEAGLTWRLTDSKCVRICVLSNATNETFISGLNTANLGECLCAVGYVWDSINAKCLKNCNTDMYATSNNVLNPTECRCVPGFYWSTTAKKCVRICGFNQPDIYSVSLKTSSVNECICADGFIWRSSDSHCVRNCSRSIDIYAVETNPTIIDQCVCQSGFYFNDQQLKCMRNCSTQIDPHSTGTKMTNFGECNCEYKYFWRVTDSRCVRNCSKQIDPYADSTNNSKIQECVCIANCYWNSSTNSCKPSSSYPIQLARSYTPMAASSLSDRSNQNAKVNLIKQDLKAEENGNVDTFLNKINQNNEMEYQNQKRGQSSSSNTANILIIVLGVLGGVMTVLLFGSISIKLINKERSRKDKKQKDGIEVGSVSSKNIEPNLEAQQNM